MDLRLRSFVTRFGLLLLESELVWKFCSFVCFPSANCTHAVELWLPRGFMVLPIYDMLLLTLGMCVWLK